MAKSFKVLKDKMSPEARQCSEQLAGDLSGSIKSKCMPSVNKNLQNTIDDMKRWIDDFVAAGFQTEEQIVDGLPEVFADDVQDVELLREPARKLTREAVERHLLEQESWPEVTDCDRLDAAFEELEASGIISRQDFSCCGTCGSYDIGEPIRAAMDAGKVIRGYIFYHQQDTEAAVGGQGLCFNYGSVEEGKDAALKIAHEAVSILKKHGFDPKWNGSWNQRIQLPIDWKRRRAVY